MTMTNVMTYSWQAQSFLDSINTNMDFGDNPTNQITFELPLRQFTMSSPFDMQKSPDSIQRDDQELTIQHHTVRHTRQQWQDIRPIFTVLYHQSDQKLEDVMKEMSTKHEFHATKAMYKKRIREWKLRRNLSAAEKDRLGQEASLLIRESQDPSMLREVAKLNHWDRVRRHDRMHKQRQGIWRQFSQKRRMGKVTTENSPMSDTSLETINNLRLPDEYQNTQDLLFRVQNVVTWHSIHRTVTTSGVYQQFMDCFNMFEDGFTYLPLNQSSQVSQLFLKAGKLFDRIVVHLDPFVLVGGIVSLWRDTHRGQYQDMIQSFALRTISHYFNAYHPISLLSKLLLEVTQSKQLGIVILQAMVDAMPADVLEEVRFDVQLQLCFLRRRAGHLESAYNLCQNMVSYYSSTNNRHYRSASLELGMVRYYQGYYGAAESIWRQIVRSKPANDGNKRHDQSGIRAARYLGYLLQEAGRIREASEHFYEGFRKACEELNEEDAELVDCLDDLLNFVSRYGSLEEMKELKNDHGAALQLLSHRRYPYDWFLTCQVPS